jgi:hypothetical protein
LALADEYRARVDHELNRGEISKLLDDSGADLRREGPRGLAPRGAAAAARAAAVTAVTPDPGDAYGGDVDQSQNASNSNATSQTAGAYSKAWQLWPRNEARGNDEKEVMDR